MGDRVFFRVLYWSRVIFFSWFRSWGQSSTLVFKGRLFFFCFFYCCSWGRSSTLVFMRWPEGNRFPFFFQLLFLRAFVNCFFTRSAKFVPEGVRQLFFALDEQKQTFVPEGIHQLFQIGHVVITDRMCKDSNNPFSINYWCVKTQITFFIMYFIPLYKIREL